MRRPWGLRAASAARASIEQMLSYNYKTIDAQAAQIETLLTGPFKAEFTSAMDKEIKPLAVKNQTVVEAKVSDIGVMSSSVCIKIFIHCAGRLPGRLAGTTACRPANSGQAHNSKFENKTESVKGSC